MPALFDEQLDRAPRLGPRPPLDRRPVEPRRAQRARRRSPPRPPSTCVARARRDDDRRSRPRRAPARRSRRRRGRRPSRAATRSAKQRAAIASRASGFSTDERSPGSAPSAAALHGPPRTIFAGASWAARPRTRPCRARTPCRARRRLRRDLRRRARPSARDPGSRQQKIQAISPFTSCGTPTAAASRTAGCATAADSSSAGPIRLPAMLSVSSERPCRNQKPSASTEAQSPCTHTPGMRRQ